MDLTGSTLGQRGANEICCRGIFHLLTWKLWFVTTSCICEFFKTYAWKLYNLPDVLSPQAMITTDTEAWFVPLPTLDFSDWLNFELSWSATAGLSVYVNGDNAGNASVAVTRQETVTVTSTALFIGRRHGDATATSSGCVIEEVTTFNATRPDMEELNLLMPGRRNEATQTQFLIDLISTFNPPTRLDIFNTISLSLNSFFDCCMCISLNNFFRF